MRPRLLLIAYCCSPEGGSEPAVGWALTQLAAEQFDVTVVVEEHKFGPAIRAWICEHGPIPNVHFEFVAEKWWAHGMWAAGAGYLSYRWWHSRAYARALSLHRDQPFDCVQLATIIGFREPGPWARFPAPFIWGPVGGTDNFVRAFEPEVGCVAGLKERIRTWVNDWQRFRSARVSSALHAAHTVVAATRAARNALQEVVPRPISVVSEITLRSEPGDTRFAKARSRSSADPLRIYWSGLHEPRKCLSILIRAVAKLPADVPVDVVIAGGGPMTERWQQLASELDVADRITFRGWLLHDEAIAEFGSADVFAFTSVRDTTGTVLLEALDAGVPVIALDHQGAADVVTDECGLLVPVTKPDETVDRFADAIVRLARDEELRSRLASKAMSRADDYRLPAKLEQWRRIWAPFLYPSEECLGDSSDAVLLHEVAS